MQNHTNNNKSILFISLLKGAPWGGSEQLWFKTALHAAKNGYAVTCAVYDLEGKEEKLKVLSQAGCNLIMLPFAEKKKQIFKKLYYKVYSKHIANFKLKKVVDGLSRNYYDHIVINQSGFMDVINDPWVDFTLNSKTSALVYHNYIEKYTFSLIKAEKMRKWQSSVSHNLFAANHMKDVISRQLDFSIPNSSLIFNPIAFQPNQTNFNINEKSCLRMVMLAALIASTKAQDCLITVLSSEKWKTRNWTLEFYGDGPDKLLLTKMIEKSGLGTKIFLRGFTNDVKAVLNDAHVLLQVTKQDAMPIAVIEAMAVGRPVVVSRIGDMPQWVSEDVNGWIAEDTSYEEVDRVLETLWLNRLSLPSMGDKSFEIFKNKFPENIEERFLSQITKENNQ